MLGLGLSLVYQKESFIKIGATYQGGIIFYVDGSGGVLISASLNDTTSIYGCYGTNISGAAGTAVGTGNQNTLDIVAAECPAGPTAGNRCYDKTSEGYSDWFLPSKDELNLMHANIGQGNTLGLGNIGGFEDGYYWSSTEYSDNKSWTQAFTPTYTLATAAHKNSLLYVRAIRLINI